MATRRTLTRKNGNGLLSKRERLKETSQHTTHTTHVTEPPNIKVLKRYPKEKCTKEGCTRNAVGSGDVCKRHGGNPVIKDNLMELEEIPNSRLVTSLYDPAVHPMQYIELSRTGMSDVEIAADMEVGTGTLRNWSEKFKEFNTAYEIGQALHEAWWLQEGKANLDNRGYNTGLFKFLTGNKLGYSDKIESKNLNVTAGVLLVPASMSENDWEKAIVQQKQS